MHERTEERLAAMLDTGRRELTDRLLAIRNERATAVATAYSDDGLVSATVDGRLRLVDLSLDERVFRTSDSAALAHTILTTVHAAADATVPRAGGDHGRV
ncbi:YbaB/EbfC family nucleoid-associated protein [Actinophytocola sp. NPDC049390]|uniref:YbaB/EbfC family nucleoid-associated protein n=1 Tax=Actinophytocola sp. NPDC049390 TaxID=3363894 RepID=UPI00379C44C7